MAYCGTGKNIISGGGGGAVWYGFRTDIETPVCGTLLNVTCLCVRAGNLSEALPALGGGMKTSVEVFSGYVEVLQPPHSNLSNLLKAHF